MKVLICGSRGQLGSDCVKVLQSTHDVTAKSSRDLDITNLEAVKDSLQRTAADIVLNCAAYTKVDACETEKDRAWKVNVDGPKNLAIGVSEYGGRLIHISTDYVFDGLKKPPEPYTEDDKPTPLSYYGITKFESEQVIRRITDKHIIIRSAWVFGLHGSNFLKTMLKLVLKNPGRELKVVNDQHGSPTWSYRLAQQIGKLIEVNGSGTYHATSEGHCTWYELAVYFLEKMGVEHNIHPCSTDEYPTPAARPGNSILENKRLAQEGNNIMPRWQNEVDRFVGNYREALVSEVSGTKR